MSIRLSGLSRQTVSTQPLSRPRRWSPAMALLVHGGAEPSKHLAPKPYAREPCFGPRPKTRVRHHPPLHRGWAVHPTFRFLSRRARLLPAAAMSQSCRAGLTALRHNTCSSGTHPPPWRRIPFNPPPLQGTQRGWARRASSSGRETMPQYVATSARIPTIGPWATDFSRPG
ncbi:hypothetical protein LZ31DRAFT_292 [Colletotrichum somersetense]|nr:hypothetical protein LZ31DRAFT_292 [Colletotrichum somersetense]